MNLTLVGRKNENAVDFLLCCTMLRMTDSSTARFPLSAQSLPLRKQEGKFCSLCGTGMSHRKDGPIITACLRMPLNLNAII